MNQLLERNSVTLGEKNRIREGAFSASRPVQEARLPDRRTDLPLRQTRPQGTALFGYELWQDINVVSYALCFLA